MTDTDNSISLAVDIDELLASRRQIAHIWGVDDVQEVRPDLNDDDAWTVLHACKRNHDCNYGITLEVIEVTADIRFPITDSHEEGEVARSPSNTYAN